MAIDDITDPGAVRRAVDEFHELGQGGFLDKYAFGASRGWMLRTDDGREYDAKGDCQKFRVRGRVDHHAVTNLPSNIMAN